MTKQNLTRLDAYGRELDDHEPDARWFYCYRSQVAQEIERLQKHNDDLLRLSEQRAYRVSSGDEPTPKRAYFETHSPPHCPTCECVVGEAAPIDPATWSALKSSEDEDIYATCGRCGADLELLPSGKYRHVGQCPN